MLLDFIEDVYESHCVEGNTPREIMVPVKLYDACIEELKKYIFVRSNEARAHFIFKCCIVVRANREDVAVVM